MGGTVTGLEAGQTVALSLNGGPAQAFGAGPFTFDLRLAEGSGYVVLVVSPPTCGAR